MRHVGCLIKHFSNSQIADFNAIIFTKEHIDGLDIPVQNLVRVQVQQPQTHLDKEFPDLGFGELAAHLLFKVEAKIAILAQFHYNVDLVISRERFHQLYDVLIVELLHELGLFLRLCSLVSAHLPRVDLF